MKKETKSHIDKNQIVDDSKLTPAVRELLKQNSQQSINTYATMVPISKPLYSKTEKMIPSNNFMPENQKNNPNTVNKKIRKLSDEEEIPKYRKIPGDKSMYNRN